MEKKKKDIVRAVAAGVLSGLLGLALAGLIWGNGSVSRGADIVYENTDLNIRFSYPDTYSLSEYSSTGMTQENSSYDIYKQITLSASGEGQTSTSTSFINLAQTVDVISIDVFGRQGEVDIVEWVNEYATSSYVAFSDKTFETALVGNKKIISYNWMGESNANTLALIHNGRVFLISVVYTSPSDDIREDFISLLSSIEFI